ncbi:MAG TPA: hypothetical protein VMV94_15445 [Phycisphaerae bacterium]|nr:hypothetical protein [Phycisphaerae bacterium]
MSLAGNTSLPQAGKAAEELGRINAELAALMQCPPAELVAGADRSLSDSLIICGILGGKDVGKSTLINALAERPVSGGHEEVGDGTIRPMAYIHRDAVSSYRGRFADRPELIGSLEICEHAADAIRNVVLVDLPDFDSDLPRHVETVKALLPLLDRIIWVVTPRKIADREWVRLLRDTVKARDNVHCVLNKADELLGDDDYARGLPPTWLQEQLGWACGILEQSQCPYDGDHLFVLAARAPSVEAFASLVSQRWGDPGWLKYRNDRNAVSAIGKQLVEELARLRECVLAPLAADRAQAIKRANRQLELRHNADRISAHYRLDDWTRRLDAACDADRHQQLVNEAFGVEFCGTVGRRLALGRRSETELADELLAEHVGLWPILPIIFWPMRWLVRRVGARFAGLRWTTSDAGEEIFTVRGQSLEERLQLYLDRFRGDHGRVIQRFNLAARLPDVAPMARHVAARSAMLVSEIDDEILALLRQAYRGPSFVTRWLLWLILIWFPLGQPLADGFLKLVGAEGKVDILGGMLTVVSAMGAVHLLTGLVFVAFVYTIILASMYARCVGRVRRARRSSADSAGDGESQALAERIDDLLVAEIVVGVSRPFVEVRQQLDDLRQRLGRLS